MAHANNGAVVILELLGTNEVDCIFASPIAVMAPLWEALAERRERGAPELPRYVQCRHETIAVAAASGYYKATGRAQAVFLPTGLGVLHGAMALRTALQERTPMTVLSPDTLTHYNPVPAALGFAQQHGAPILIVVCDNRGYTSQTWNVHKYFAGGAAVRSGQFFGNVITPTPDYVKLAEAYGGAGERVEKTADLDSAIERSLGALATGRSALLDVFVTP